MYSYGQNTTDLLLLFGEILHSVLFVTLRLLGAMFTPLTNNFAVDVLSLQKSLSPQGKGGKRREGKGSAT